MEAGDFLVSNHKIIAFVSSNRRNRLDNIKGAAAEWTCDESDGGERLGLLGFIHVLPFTFPGKVFAESIRFRPALV